MENEINQEVELEEQINDEVEVEEEIEEEPQEEEQSGEIDWKATALKYKAIAERQKKKEEVKNTFTNKLQDKAVNPDDEVVSRLSQLEMAEKKRQFGYENGLSPKETDRVFQVNPNPNADTLKDPFVKAGLDAIRRQDRVANNTPSSSAKSFSLDRKALKDATPEEKQAAFDKFMKTKQN